MAELADALDSGSSGGDFVKVQVLSSAPKRHLRVSFSYSRTEKIVCKGMQFDEKDGTMVDFFFEVC